MQAFVAFLKAIPALLEIFDRLAAAYVSLRIAFMKKEIAAGVVDAALLHDQRRLEHAIGSVTAGKPSGVPGSVTVPSLPGVPVSPQAEVKSSDLAEQP